MFTWDNAKRRRNLKQHGFDFVGAEAIFDGPVWSYEDKREDYGEQRINLVGWLDGRLMHLTYTDDGTSLRIISLREAEKHEIRRYLQSFTR